MAKPQFPIDWKEFNKLIKERLQQRDKERDEWAAEQRKPRWLIPPSGTGESPQPSQASIQVPQLQPSRNPPDEREIELPEGPIYAGQLTEEGDYYCPHGCGLIAIDDAWEAMFHDVAHFEPEDAHQMWEQHQRSLAQQEKQAAKTPAQRTEATPKDQDGEFRQKIKEAVAEAKRKKEASNMETDRLREPPKPWLSRNQKIALAVGVLLLLATGLYPPWRFVLHGPAGISGSRDVGRSYSPPDYQTIGQASPHDDFYQYNAAWIAVEVDAERQHLAWAMIILATAGACLLFSERKKTGL